MEFKRSMSVASVGDHHRSHIVALELINANATIMFGSCGGAGQAECKRFCRRAEKLLGEIDNIEILTPRENHDEGMMYGILIAVLKAEIGQRPEVKISPGVYRPDGRVAHGNNIVWYLDHDIYSNLLASEAAKKRKISQFKVWKRARDAFAALEIMIQMVTAYQNENNKEVCQHAVGVMKDLCVKLNKVTYHMERRG